MSVSLCLCVRVKCREKVKLVYRIFVRSGKRARVYIPTRVIVLIYNIFTFFSSFFGFFSVFFFSSLVAVFIFCLFGIIFTLVSHNRLCCYYFFLTQGRKCHIPSLLRNGNVSFSASV